MQRSISRHLLEDCSLTTTVSEVHGSTVLGRFVKRIPDVPSPSGAFRTESKPASVALEGVFFRSGRDRLRCPLASPSIPLRGSVILALRLGRRGGGHELRHGPDATGRRHGPRGLSSDGGWHGLAKPGHDLPLSVIPSAARDLAVLCLCLFTPHSALRIPHWEGP